MLTIERLTKYYGDSSNSYRKSSKSTRESFISTNRNSDSSAKSSNNSVQTKGSTQERTTIASTEFETAAVKDLSLELEKGRFLAIVGRSGSGKSTLLGMLGGISKPTTGSIKLDGIDQWKLSDNDHADFRNRKIGFVFQFASLLSSLRAIDNVALPALVGGTLSSKEAYARARVLLERVGLADCCDRYPGQLSGGQQRRVSIARALINSPELLLADEPTADLDEETEEEILSLLVDIHRAFKLTLIVVTHNPAIADRADQLLKMRDGKLEIIIDQPDADELLLSAHLPAGQNQVMTGSETALEGASNELLDFSPHRTDDVVQAKLKSKSRELEVIFNTPETAISAENVRLGEGMDRLLGRFVMWLLPIIALVWGVNFGVATYENSVIENKESERLALESLAMSGLRADIQDVTLGPDNTYDVSIYLRNTLGEKPLYVLAPTVRAFVQVGTNWTEVPLRAADEGSGHKVIKVTGKQIFHYSLKPDVSGFSELIPYYMHVRLTNDMLVSGSSQPKSDLIDRSDSYYIYLKPHGADNAAILKKLKFPADPPVWIPMPPH